MAPLPNGLLVDKLNVLVESLKHKRDDLQKRLNEDADILKIYNDTFKINNKVGVPTVPFWLGLYLSEHLENDQVKSDSLKNHFLINLFN